jgi:hypothetical protein
MDALIDQFDAADPDKDDDKVEDPPFLDLDIDITSNKKRFTTLHLEEPKAKQIERAERELNTQTPTPYHFRRYQMALIAQVARVPDEVVGELTNTQLRAAWNFLRAKLEPDTPETGETSLPT